MQFFQHSKQFQVVLGMLLLVLILLTSCQNAVVLEPSPQPTTATIPIIPSSLVTRSNPHVTDTSRVTTNSTPPPLPNTPTPAATTPPLSDEEVLARAVMPSSDRAYCSWQILGQAKRKLFVWAFCVDVGKYAGAKGSGPAIIHLDDQGHYRQVKWALDGTQYAAIVKQFPQDAQQAIANPDQQNGLRINMQALEWGVQMRGIEFNTAYIIPLFDPSGSYCTEGPTKTSQNLPSAEGKDYSGWKTYTQVEDGFSFNLPSDWSVEESWFSCIQRPPAPHWLFLQPPGGLYNLLITFRKPDEAENIERSGTPAGEFSDAGTLTFLGKQVRIQRVIYEKRDMAVFYNDAAEFQSGGLLFTLSLNITSDPDNNRSIPPEIEAQAAQILKSFHTINKK